MATNSQANRQTVIKTGCVCAELNVTKLINRQIKTLTVRFANVQFKILHPNYPGFRIKCEQSKHINIV